MLADHLWGITENCRHLWIYTLNYECGATLVGVFCTALLTITVGSNITYRFSDLEMSGPNTSD